MTKMSSPWLIAWLGHSGSHAPQLMHSSVMMVAMPAAALPFPSRFRLYATNSYTAVRSADPNRLHVDEFADPFARKLPPVPRLLDAAERQARVALDHAVDEDAPSLELVGQAIDLFGIVAERGRAQPELRVVGLGDGVVQVPGAHHRRDRTEYFLAPRLGAQRVQEDRRRVEEPLS